MSKTKDLLSIRHQEFVMPDIKLNSKIYNPNRKKSKADDANTLRDLKYQYFTKHEDERKAFRAARQFTDKDTQIRYSTNRDSVSFLMVLKKAEENKNPA